MTQKQKLRKDTIRYLKTLLAYQMIQKRKLSKDDRVKTDTTAWKWDLKQNKLQITWLKYSIKVLSV